MVEARYRDDHMVKYNCDSIINFLLMLEVRNCLSFCVTLCVCADVESSCLHLCTHFVSHSKWKVLYSCSVRLSPPSL